MSSIRELYESSIEYEHVTLAHCILHLLQEGKVSLEDDESMLDLSLANSEQLDNMIENNLLGFSQVRIFSLKQKKNTFAFIYAKFKGEARKHFRETLKTTPINCHEYPLDFEMVKGNRVVSFREMKKEFDCFPVMVGVYERGRVYGA
ncbi:hypothetical protein [Bacillus sp. 2205SS5-2]|uniref:hypothetical protein n=1 Tax=Bacillus sp. 2205SS5-2 TaxID=3109031 RepID=UPI0030048433